MLSTLQRYWRSNLFSLSRLCAIGACLVLLVNQSASAQPHPKPGGKEKQWFVDIFIKLFYDEGKLIESYEDQQGHVHHSGKEFYAVTVIKGSEGGPVHYRFNSESVILRVTKEGTLVFKSSSSQQLGLESKYFTDSLVAQLPANYTMRLAKKYAAP